MRVGEAKKLLAEDTVVMVRSLSKPWYYYRGNLDKAIRGAVTTRGCPEHCEASAIPQQLDLREAKVIMDSYGVLMLIEPIIKEEIDILFFKLRDVVDRKESFETILVTSTSRAEAGQRIKISDPIDEVLDLSVRKVGKAGHEWEVVMYPKEFGELRRIALQKAQGYLDSKSEK